MIRAFILENEGLLTLEKLNKEEFILTIKTLQLNENWINTIIRSYPFLYITNPMFHTEPVREYILRFKGKPGQSLIDDLLKYRILTHEQIFSENFKKITIPFYKKAKKDVNEEYILIERDDNIKDNITKLNDYIKNLEIRIKDLENTNNRIYLALQAQT